MVCIRGVAGSLPMELALSSAGEGQIRRVERAKQTRGAALNSITVLDKTQTCAAVALCAEIQKQCP